MKKILIICEDDLIGNVLIRSVQALAHDKRIKFYRCNIDIVDCGEKNVLFPIKSKKLSGLHKSHSVGAIQPADAVMTEGIKTIQANTCKDIIASIRSFNIDTVVLPIFLHDTHRKLQYETIVKDILKHVNPTIAGIYL